MKNQLFPSNALWKMLAGALYLVLMLEPVRAQQESGVEIENIYREVVERSFGHDQLLINGVQYFDRYRGFRGVPYFMSIGFTEGDLTIRDKQYNGVLIRYDLFSQVVEIEYENFYGGTSWLRTVADHIDAFQLGIFEFKKLNLDDQSEKFYQVIGTRQFTCFIHWAKKLSPLQNERHYTHAFSDLTSSSYLELDGKISPFRNRKELVALFPERFSKAIRRFLKRNQFNVKGASPNEMILVMNAVSNLITTGGMP